MYQEVLRDIEGIGIFPAVSLVLFVAVFTLIVVYAMRIDRAGVRHMAELPLDDDDPGGFAARTPLHARSQYALANQEDEQ
jgi:cytochrome c oxidase cbb3-type subunit IV